MKKITYILNALLILSSYAYTEDLVKNDFLSGYTIQGESIEKYQYLKSGTIPDPDDPAKLNQWNGAYQEDGVTNTESPVTGGPLSYAGYVGSNENLSITLGQFPPYLARHSVYSLIEDNTFGQNCYYLAFLVNVSNTTNTRADRVFISFNGHQKGSVFRVGVSVVMNDDGFNFSLAYRDDNTTDPTSTINVKRSFDQTYLVVLKHDFSTKTASLFVNPGIGATEATPDATISTSGATFTSIRGISLKARFSYGLAVGGIRFSDSWEGAVGNYVLTNSNISIDNVRILSEEYFNVNGISINQPLEKGVYIRKTTYENSIVKVDKIFIQK